MTKTQAERLWLLGGGLVAFVLLLIGWLFFISPQRSQTDTVNGQISNAQLQNTTLQSRISSLRAQSKHLSTYRADLAAARRALPSTTGVPDFLRTLQSLGNSTLAHVTSLTVGAPVAVGQSAAAGAATPSSSPSPSSAPSSSAPAAGTGTSGAPAASGVYSLPITASVTGSTSALSNFLEQLQSVQPRAVLITHITEGGSSTGGTPAGGAAAGSGTSLQLVMSAFVAPASAPAPSSSTPGR